MTSQPLHHQDAHWRASSFCATAECVEVSACDETVTMRNSARPAEIIRLTQSEWQAFVAGVRAGDFDQLEAG